MVFLKHFASKNVLSCMSKLYTLKAVQKIPATLPVVWDFISSPENLKTITPPHMAFKQVGESDIPATKMYAGQIIAYELYPVPGIKCGWVTEITHVKDQEFFVDEQRFGPYSFWHHQHFIQPIDGGTEMTDVVRYKIPLGFLGDAAHALFVKSQLDKIFDYRYKKIEEIFGPFMV